MIKFIMKREKLSIDRQRRGAPHSVGKFILDTLKTVFPKYLAHCWCCFTIQLGVVSYGMIGITIVIIPIFINATIGKEIEKAIIPFALMAIYALVMIVGHMTLILGAFLLNRKVLLQGICIVSAGMLIWLILLSTSFLAGTLDKLVCIKSACADTQWLVDMRWRYKKKECPFNKKKPEEYPVFRREFFVDAPRDELWIETKKPDVIFNMVVNDNVEVTDFKAWYAGCESNDPTLIMDSIILSVSYLAFYGHLVWMTLSIRHQIQQDDYGFDEAGEN